MTLGRNCLSNLVAPTCHNRAHMWPSFLCLGIEWKKKLPNNSMMKIKLNGMIVGLFVFGDLFQSQKRDDELPIFFSLLSFVSSLKSHTINPHLIFALIVVRSLCYIVLTIFNDDPITFYFFSVFQYLMKCDSLRTARETELLANIWIQFVLLPQYILI